MTLSLSESHKDFIKATFRLAGYTSQIRIFGSYAKGVATSRSDIDISYDSPITDEQRVKIWSRLRYDAPFLMRCDIVSYTEAPPALRDHIDRVGVVL